SWEEAAIDALNNCHPFLGKHKDWSIGATLDKLEAYNGLGYRKKGLPSPYLWAGTDQYVKGKYVADGKFDPNHVDMQLGVAPLLMKIRENAKDAPKPAPATPQPPTAQPAPAPVSVPKRTLLQIILDLIAKIFGRKQP